MKIVKVQKNHFFLVILGLAGIVFLFIGWVGLPQNSTGTSKGEKESSPAATLVENEEENQEGNEQESGIQGDNTMTTEEIWDEQLEEELTVNSDYFVDYRLERQHIRGRQLEMLRNIINNPESNEGTREQAQQRIMQIYQKINRESELENIIRAKGIKDAIVFIGEENVSVVVKDENIASQEASQICDLVARGTEVSEQDIVVIPKKAQE